MGQTQSIDPRETWRNIVTRAWSDEKFRQALIDDPNKVLAEHGVPAQPGMHFVVVENEPNRVHLVLPSKPDAAQTVKEADAGSMSWYDAAGH